ncbi:3-isopropylmalate dehydratase large subunit [Virgibacillus oceani]|uniref:3-isopropylmalate dehydratase large subunit n=1 Tax=Virgibacillus oceani TaxID=1479511 RepID=A0A917HLD3_9BACI|nr:3-isopropylmalate dehydratase large subunit [Virgibacillus oceani]GGG82840.1 3-isopropylmalate dehydratase large subunit [Virgibacillus oceani]
MTPKTLFEKVWEKHVIDTSLDLPLLFIDLHLIHDVTSPQAFNLLKEQGRTVRRPDLTFASADHNVPTTDRNLEFKDLLAKKQVDALIKNCKEFGVTVYDLDHPDNGIVHIIGPELGLTTPGKTIVCGDSHTSTHGAFGAFAFGIGSSEITHVLATQTLPQAKPKTMNIQIDGEMPDGVSSKDIILRIIGEIGTHGGVGHVVEFTGSTVKNMSMDERMTICNMVLEAGARSGMIAPDETTFAYLKNRKFVPKGEKWNEAVAEWSELYSDPGAVYDKTVTINIDNLAPQATWGTNPGQVTSIDKTIPSPKSFTGSNERTAAESALDYMDLNPATNMNEIEIDRIFIGSCTNARIEDLRLAAQVAYGHKVHNNVTALVVPGSYHIKRRAEQEGLDKVFIDAGFEWREPGCSMCPGMNPDIANPGDRVASTSNRNFEGRQGKGVRTHLVSPAMAAAAAITGHLTDIRKWNYKGGLRKNEAFS